MTYKSNFRLDQTEEDVQVCVNIGVLVNTGLRTLEELRALTSSEWTVLAWGAPQP